MSNRAHERYTSYPNGAEKNERTIYLEEMRGDSAILEAMLCDYLGWEDAQDKEVHKTAVECRPDHFNTPKYVNRQAPLHVTQTHSDSGTDHNTDTHPRSSPTVTLSETHQSTVARS